MADGTLTLQTRRRVLGALGPLLAAGPLAACGGQAQPSGSQTQAVPTAVKPTGTVEFWHQWSTRTPVLRGYLDQFERESGVKMVDQEFTSLGAQGGDRTKIVSSIIAGTVPDCLMIFKNMIALVVPAKVLLGLNQYVARDKIDLKQFVDAEIKARTFSGELISLPNGAVSGAALFFHKAHLRQIGANPDRPPATWSQLEDLAVRLTVGQGDGAERLGINPTGSFLTWFYNNGGRMYSDDGRRVAFDTPEARDTLQWLIQLGRRQSATGPLFETTGINSRPLFYQGKLSTYVGGDILMGLMQADPAGKTVDWGIAPLPHNDRNPQAKLSVPVQIGTGYSVTTGGRNREGAWALAKFLSGSDAQCGFMTKDQGRTAALKRCNLNAPGDASAAAAFSIFSRQMESGVAVPFTPGDDTAVAALEKYAQEAVLGKTSPDTAIRTAAQEAQVALDDGWQQWRT